MLDPDNKDAKELTLGASIDRIIWVAKIKVD